MRRHARSRLLGLVAAVGVWVSAPAEAARIRQITPPCAGIGVPVTITGRGLRRLHVLVGGVRAIVLHQRSSSATVLVPGGVAPGPTTVELFRRTRPVARAPFQVAGPAGCGVRGPAPRGPAGCAPGTMQACYDGPPGTEGVGICRAGAQLCDAGGSFGPCEGEVLPAAEIPGNGIDEDCNGTDGPGGGEFCVPGDVEPCYDGPPRTAGVGPCKAGVRMCGGAGLFGACEGEVLPASDLTIDGVDQNCDGVDGPIVPNLVLTVNPAFSPTFQPSQVITGSVGTEAGPPASPPPAPMLTALDPAAGHRGDTLDVTITGQDTGFQTGQVQANFGPGVTVNSLTVNDPTSVTVNVTVAVNADLGPRLVAVSTGQAEAIVPTAFQVLPGLGTLAGRLVDAGGQPVSGGQVCVEGTTTCTTSGADGTFTLPGVPSTPTTRLDVTAPGFDPLGLPVAVMIGGSEALGDLPLAFPEEPPPPPPPGGPPISAQLATVLGRGVGRIENGGNPTLLQKLVRDALIATGGDAAGVLDASGNQLNLSVTGNGVVSLQDRGVTDLARDLAAGDSVQLGEVLGDFFLNLHYGTGAETPPLVDVLDGLQQEVNAAWADPSRPQAPLWIALFNQGNAVSVDPPVLTATTALNALQHYLVLSSLLAYWEEALDPTAVPAAAVRTRAASVAPRDAAPEGAQPSQAGHDPLSLAWQSVLTAAGHSSFTVNLGTGAVTGESTLPIALTKAFLNNEEAGLAAAERFNAFFSTLPVNNRNVGRIQQLFTSQDFKQAFELAKAEAQSVAKLAEFARVGAGFVTEVLSVMAGKVVEGILDVLAENVIESLRPEPPEMEQAIQVVAPDGTLSQVTEVFFKRSGNDHTANNPSNVHFSYEVFREQHGTLARIACCKVSAPDGANADNIRELSAAEPDTLVSVDFPDPGPVLYRARATRLIGQATVVPQEMLNPLLAFLSQGVIGQIATTAGSTIIRTEGLQIALSPVATILRGIKFQRSEVSEPIAAFISIKAPPAQPPASTAVVPHGGGEFVSIAPTGNIFRAKFDPTGQFLETYTAANFKAPGQAGLAADGGGNLYSDNAASDPIFGGRLFKFTPPSGLRQLVGSVQYFSFLLNFARPVAVEALAVGPSPQGEALYVADAQSETIKRLFPLTFPPNADRNVAQPFAQSILFNFAPDTTLAFAPDGTLMVGQGPDILAVSADGSQVQSLFDPATAPSPFQDVSGLTFDRAGNLYASDGALGTITEIPAPEIVPGATFKDSSAVDRKKRLVARGVPRPTDIKLATNAHGLFFFDQQLPARRLAFGVSGQLVDGSANPLPNFTIAADRSTGQLTTTTDGDGVFVLPGLLAEGEPSNVLLTMKGNGRSAGIGLVLDAESHNIRDLTFPDQVVMKPSTTTTTGTTTTTTTLPTKIPVHAPPGRTATVCKFPITVPKLVPPGGSTTPPPANPPGCPRARFCAPADGLATADPTVEVSGFLVGVTGVAAAELLVNGVPQPLDLSSGDFSATVTLGAGENVLAIALPRDVLLARHCISPAITRDFVPVPLAVSIFHDADPSVVAAVQRQRGFDVAVTAEVVDTDTNAPVAGAHFAAGTPEEAYSDEDGVVQMNVASGSLPGGAVALPSVDNPSVEIDLQVDPN